MVGIGENDKPDARRGLPVLPEIIHSGGAEVEWIGALGEGLMVGEIAEVIAEIELIGRARLRQKTETVASPDENPDEQRADRKDAGG